MRIIEDKRKIKSAWTDACHETGPLVGYEGITAITPYEENGQMEAVTWLKVWKGDVVVARLNTALVVEITYAEEEPAHE